MKHNYQNTSPQSIFGVSKAFRNGMFLCFFLLASFLGSAQTNYYVATTGNDTTGSGTSVAPYATLAKVFSTHNLGAGDVIYVAAGTYSEKDILVGTNDEGFTIQGANLSAGAPTTIFDSDNSRRWLTIKDTSNDNITINNITVKDYTSTGSSGGMSNSGNGGGGIFVQAGVTATTINNCVFDNCRNALSSTQYGGAIHSADYIIINKSVFKNCISDVNGGAVALYATSIGGAYTSTLPSLIDKCSFFSNSSTSGDGSAITMGIGSSKRLNIQNSLIYNNDAGANNGAISSVNSSVIEVLNCTVYGNKTTSQTSGIYTASSTCYVFNTISVGNQGSGNLYNDINSASSTLNVTNSYYQYAGSINNNQNNTVGSTPGFVDAAAYNFNLTSSATVIDGGAFTATATYGGLTAPTDDILAIARTNNPDIGAYEYISGPTITPNVALNTFTTCEGTASTEQSITVSAINLTNDITVTAPTGFEISLTTGTGFGSSVTLTQSSGSVSNAVVFIRIAASASGNVSGNITLTSTGATTQNVAVTGYAVPTSGSVVLGDNTSGQQAAANVIKGSAKNSISKFQLTATGDAVLTSLSFTTANSGTAYTASDFTKFQLYYNTTNTLAGATQVGADITSGLTAGTKTFTGFSQIVLNGSDNYFWITADVGSGATATRKVLVDAITSSDFTLLCGSKSGSASAGGIQTVVASGTYYSKYSTANTEATTASNWNTNRDGSGADATTFTNAGDVFTLQSGHRYQVGAAWTGTSTSDIYVEDGGALDVNGANAATIITWRRFYLAGNGVDVSGVLTGALFNSSATAASFARPITLTAAAKISSYTGTGGLTLAAGATVATGGFLLTLDGEANTTLTDSGVISGTGGLTKKGNGLLVITSTNTFTGTVILEAGTVRNTATGAISANGAFGNSAAAIQLNGAALEVNNITFTRPISVTANGSRIDAYGAARTALAIPISATGNYTLQLGGTTNGAFEGQAMTLTAVISDGTGTLSLEKVRTSSVTLSGTNTYTGTTTISNGILLLGAVGTATTGPLGSNTGSVVVNGGSLNLSARVFLTPKATTIYGTGYTSLGAIYSIGAAAAYPGNITVGAGGATISAGATTASSLNTFSGTVNTDGNLLTLGNSTDLSSRVLVFSNVISGTGGVTKAGPAILNLTGANTYSGTTTHSAGTLNINNNSAIGTGTFSIGAGTVINGNSTSGAGSAAVVLSTNNPVTINGDFTYTGTNSIDFGTGNVTLTANSKITYSTNRTLKFAGGIASTSSSILGNYLLARQTGAASTLDIPQRGLIATWPLSANATGTASGFGTLSNMTVTGLSAVTFNGTTGASTTTHPTTIDTSTKYYEFQFTPTGAATVTHIMFDYSVSAGTSTTKLYYINNGGALTEFNATAFPAIANTTINKMYADLTGSPILVAAGTPIKFRIYATQTASGNAFRVGQFTIMGGAPSIILTNHSGVSLSSCTGTASSEHGIGVTGSNLVGDLVVTPPAGFEVSATSGGSFSSSVSLTPVGAAINQNVYIRLAAATSVGSYSGTVSFVCDNTSATSDSISGTVYAALSSGTATPAASSVCINSSTSITLAGNTGSNLQWQQSANGTDWVTVVGGSGGTTTTYTTPNLTTSTYYRVSVGNGVCNTIYTDSVLITVSPVTVGGSLSGEATVCATSNSTNLTLSGQTGNVTKWQYSSVADFSSDINDVSNTTSTLTATNLTSTRYYRAVVQSGACSVENSSIATITVNAASYGGTLDGDSVVCLGTNSTNLSVSGYTGSIEKWQYSSVSDFSSAVTDVSNTSNSLTANNLNVTRYYRVVVSNGVCDPAYSNVITITVTPNAYGGTISGGTSVCSGTNSTDLTLSSHVGTVSKWQYSSDDFSSDVNDVVNTTTTLTATNLTANRYYRAVVVSGSCFTAYSESVAVYVDALPSAGSVSGDATYCSSTNSTTFTLSGHTGSISKWQSALSSDFSTGLSDIANTTTSLVANNRSETTYYRVLIVSGACSVYSSTGTVTITPASVGGSVGSNQTVCTGSEPSSLTLSGYSGSIVRWESSLTTNFASPTTIANTTATLSGAAIGSLTQTTYFRAVVENGVCIVNSSYATLSVIATTWNGSAWSNGAPDINTTAFMTGNYSEAVDLAACTLTVSNNAVVTIPSGYDVHLQGLLTVNKGSTFTVNNNANLIQDNQVTNIGSISVKRNSPSLFRLDYVLWSSPTAANSVQKLSFFSPKTALTRFYTYTPASNFWTPVANPQTSYFSTGKGVLIRMPNDWIAYGAGSPATFTGTFTGVPNNGTYSVAITDGGRTSGDDIIHGYNSVGNPYPSTIDISDFINGNSSNIDGTIWLWRKTNDQNNPTSYSTCTTSACTVSNGHSYHSNDNYISVGQGYLVRSKVGASSITFNNSMRRSQNIDQFFRVNERDRYWLDVKNTSGTPFSQVAFAYIPDGTLGFDEAKDGEYINDAPTVFSCMVDGKETVIQARPSFDSNDVVNMQFRTDVADNYEISINKMEGIFPNQDIYIKDNLLGVEHNLKSGPYTFASEVGTFGNRFEMRYQPALDVENPDFTANQVVVYKNNNMIHVNSGIQDMATIKIYDVRGRLILTKSNVNSTNFTISADDFAKEVLLFEITSSTGIKVTKKVVN